MQVAVLTAEIIADHTIDHESSVRVRRRSEDFTAGKIAPFLRHDDAARFEPFQLRRKFRFEISTVRRATLYALSMSRPLDQPLTKCIDRPKIGAHSFTHDLRRDIDHMRVTDSALVHHIAHLHARAEFARLRSSGEDRHLRLREIIENNSRHGCERTRRMILENKNRMPGADFFDFRLQCCRDLARRLVGDDRDAFVWPNSKANLDRVVRARHKVSVDFVDG